MSEATGTQLTRQSQELTIFHDVAKALTSSLDLDSILQTIMEKMAEYFRPDTWSLLMVDEEHDELYFAIAVGEAAEALKNVRLAFVEVSGGTPASMMPKSGMPEFPLEDEEALADEPAPHAPEKPKAATPPPASAPKPEDVENKKKFTKTYG